MDAVRRLTTAVGLILAAAAAAPVVAAAEEVASPQRATPVDADLATVAWSAYDAAAGGFRLMVRGPGGAQRALPAAVSPVPFDLDVGDDAQRHRVVVYAACPAGPASCDIRMVGVRDGVDVPVPIAARPDRSEHAPTISRGTLAWAAGGGAEERPRVWRQRLGAAGSPAAVPVLPRRRCGEDPSTGGRSCVPVFGSVGELELRGSVLAQAVTSATRIRGTTELRVVDLRTGRSRLVAGAGTGESGQRFIGPSLDEGLVYAYKTCFGDPSGCNSGAGIVRSGALRGPVELAASRRQLSGFSVDRNRLFAAEGSERRACELDQGGYPGVPGLAIGPCPIEQLPLPVTWRRIGR